MIATRPLSRAERRLAKRRNEAALLELADAFAAKVRKAFRLTFSGVTDRIGHVVTAAGFASIDDLNHIPTDWAEQVTATLVPAVRELYDVGGISALLQYADATEARRNAAHLDALPEVLDRRALDYLDEATNRLVGIGDHAWHSVREALSKGFEAGESIPDMAARVQEAIHVSEARAELISRTEVTGSVNAGQLDTIRALDEFGPQWKSWLATLDARTRPEHADADGQTVHVNEFFDVGGEQLDAPGDPSGSAAMVCACRCSLLYVDSGDATIDPAGRQSLEPAGEFVDTSGLRSVESDLADWDAKVVDLATQEDAFPWFKENLSGPLDEFGGATFDEMGAYSSTAVDHWSGSSGYKNGSELLRNGPEALRTSLAGTRGQAETIRRTEQTVADLDRMFESGQWRTKADSVFWRGAERGGFDGPVGSVIEDRSFVSTSNRREVSVGYLGYGRDGVPRGAQLIEVLVPRGTSVLSVSPREGELLLNRGSRFEILWRDDSAVPSRIKVRLLPRNPSGITASAALGANARSKGDPDRFVWKPGDVRIVGHTKNVADDTPGRQAAGTIALPNRNDNMTDIEYATPAPMPAPVAPVAPVAAPVTNPGTPGPGRTFETLLTVEGRWTGDERIIMADALTWDGLLPMPLTISHDDHPDAVCGIVTEIERRPGPTADERLIVGRGIFDDGFEAGAEVLRKIEGGFLRGVSVDIDTIVEGGIDPAAVETDPNAGWRSVVETARIRGLALTSLPAFAEAYITLDVVDTKNLPPAPDPTGPAPLTHDDPKVTAPTDMPTLDEMPPCATETVVLAAGTGYRVVTAAPAVDAPPFDWFANPSLPEPTALTVTADGHVFGHIALWGTCHTGITGQCVTPPTSASNYAGFLLGEVLCSDGARVPVGHLTVGTGHADPELGWRPAADHYDRTGTAVADVFAGEDPYGIWVAGAVRKTASASEVAALRASPISGDWRRMGTNLELVAALAVNVPGFPVHRVRSMVAAGVQVSLVAAGVLDAKTLTRARARAAAERIAATIGRDRGSLAAGLVARVHPEEG